MGVAPDRQYQRLGPEDPDDYRPNSELAFVIDPTAPDGGHVRSLSLIFENCAPGDRVPLHTHSIDEAVIVESGDLEATLGDERYSLTAGATAFIPAGTPHGWRNIGDSVARFHGIFPSDVIDITYIERNPAPGTEGDAPQPPATLDLRQLTDG
jgi:mannose-6-phosphate isomerase-like protein (cupin superfamily)